MEMVATKLFDSSEIVQKTAKKLLIELKRVYSDEVKTLIDRISSKRLRNCCNKILEYDLEIESEDELQQPVQKILQKQKSIPPKINTNNNFSVQPIAQNEKDHEKVRQIKDHFISDRKSHMSVTKNTTISRPNQPPKLTDEDSSSEVSKPDIAATKTKPFIIRETPKKQPQRKVIEKSPTSDKSPKKQAFSSKAQEKLSPTKESLKSISIKETENKL